MVNLAYLFENSFLILGSSKSYLIKIFFVLLAAQLAFRSDYVYPVDYLTRTSPTYNPQQGSQGTGLLGFFSNLLGSLISVPDNACERSKRKSDLTFDFIVVGAGAAGSVIAAALSDNPAWKVLLIEAGGDPVVESVDIGLFLYGLNNSRVWRYNAEVVNTSSQAFKNGCQMAHGKHLGGSTGTNAMLYVCGTDSDYNHWAELGNYGWTYDEILPFIKKSERNHDSSKSKDYHGFDGPLSVSSYPLMDPFVHSLRSGFNELGYKNLSDINSGEYNGFVELQGTVKDGERCSAYHAFIRPIKERPNLFIVKNGLVTNILFNGTSAIGVNVKTSLPNCPNIQFKASKETIISGGGLNSPKILLQSGIGPSDELAKLDIPVVKDSPGVGKNLQDHVYPIHFVKINKNAVAQEEADVLLDIVKYLTNRTGNLAHIGTPNAEGFINTLDPNALYPDIQMNLHHLPRSAEDIVQLLSNFGYKDSYLATLKEANDESELIIVFTILLNPEARGTVELRGKDPELTPKITSNFLTNRKDIDTLIRGINKLKALLQTEAFKSYKPEIVKFDIKECNSLPYPSDEYEECYLRYVTAALWHPTGTCKMGLANDTTAVVSPELLVHGISNLRVADASIMPKIPSANTQCPTYAVGQKAAHMITKTWTST